MKAIFSILLFLLLTKFQIFAEVVSDSSEVFPNTIDRPYPGKFLSEINYPEKYNPLEKEINYKNLAITSGLVGGTIIGIHIYQANAWWQDQSNVFKIKNDWNYALWIDKTGHFFGTNLTAHFLTAFLESSDLDQEDAYLYGAISAFCFEMYIEIEDGFGPYWGFSPGDALSDFLGASFYLSQYYFPYMRNFQPKVSYYPSEKFRQGLHKGNNIIDDYEGQKYWMGMRMKNILPKNLSEYWPSILMLSVGMGVSNLNGSGGGIRNIYIGLDIDTEQLPFLHGQFGNFIKNTLNYIHFPMPGIRISPTAAFFGLVY